MGEKLRGEADYRYRRRARVLQQLYARLVCVRFRDNGMVCPLAKMYTLGSNFIPSPNTRRPAYHG
jgi:tryptophan synthase beta chain